MGTKISPASKKSFLNSTELIFRGSLRGRPRGFPQVPGSNWPKLFRDISTLLYHASESERGHKESRRDPAGSLNFCIAEAQAYRASRRHLRATFRICASR